MEEHGDNIFQYRPFLNDIDAIVLNRDEMIFIDFIERQLKLSNHFMLYCLGWNEQDVIMNMTLKKLAKYFENIYFTSAPNGFSSQLLMIYSSR